jgi:hypothetical protein
MCYAQVASSNLSSAGEHGLLTLIKQRGDIDWLYTKVKLPGLVTDRAGRPQNRGQFLYRLRRGDALSRVIPEQAEISKSPREIHQLKNLRTAATEARTRFAMIGEPRSRMRSKRRSHHA